MSSPAETVVMLRRLAIWWFRLRCKRAAMEWRLGDSGWSVRGSGCWIREDDGLWRWASWEKD